jgi:Protein of Unknown function (DUF2784)
MIADAVLVVHALFVLFVVGGFVLILIGAGRWDWVRNRKFRILHLAAIAFVTAEALLGVTCPLTLWEDALRGKGTERTFVGRWAARLLYYDFPEWVFVVVYCAFTLAVVCAWWLVPPRARAGKAL